MVFKTEWNHFPKVRIKTAKIELKVGAEVQMNELLDEVEGYVIDISRCQETKEQAIAFCEKRAWSFEVGEERKTAKRYGFNGYDENFLPKTVKSLIKEQKMGMTFFERDAAGTSNYFRPLKYHGDGVVPQHGPNGGIESVADVPGYYKQR